MDETPKEPGTRRTSGLRTAATLVGALVAVVLVILALTLIFAVLREPAVGLLADLSGHAARRLAYLLGGIYVVAGSCVFAAARTELRVVRALLWIVFGLVVLLTVLILPGRDGNHPAERVSASDGNLPAFGSVLSWMAISALFVFLILGIGCSFIFSLRNVWRAALALLIWVSAWFGVTSLVAHANADGPKGDPPLSILAHLALVQPAGSTQSGIHRGAPEVKFTTVRHFDTCASAATLVDPPATVPNCRDALQLEGTGWTAAKKPEGGFSCVLFAPQLGDDFDDWKVKLDKATVAVRPTGNGHLSEVSYDETYDDGTRVWFVCAERRGHLRPGSTGAPLLADIAEIVTATDVGLL